jgi:hypothetical protein
LQCPDHAQQVEPTVFLAVLPPASEKDTPKDVFWRRFKQIETLLSGFEVAARGTPAELRMLCLDGLNVFGGAPLSRHEQQQLFDLFRRKGVIGVCTCEEGAAASTADTEYLADVVIRLSTEEDAGYSVRYLQITKSRYQRQVDGKHPYRIRKPPQKVPPKQRETTEEGHQPEFKPYFQPFMASPSIHYVSYATKFKRKPKKKSSPEEKEEPEKAPSPEEKRNDESAKKSSPKKKEEPEKAASPDGKRNEEPEEESSPRKFDMGIESLEGILPHSMRRPSVVAVRGRAATYKTAIAQNFLIAGLAKGEDVLLLTLGEIPAFQGDWSRWAVAEDLWKKMQGHDPSQRKMKFNAIEEEQLDDSKLCRKVWEQVWDPVGPSSEVPPRLIEIAFKQGALLPEEFLEYVRDVMRMPRKKGSPVKVRRVVLDDVSVIGTSYPLLRQSKTAGDLFLSTFVHLIRAKNADLVMTGTPGNFKEADEMVNRACTLSNTVLSTDFCDVFGQRFVLVTGEGLMSGQAFRPKTAAGHQDRRPVPGVVEVLEGPPPSEDAPTRFQVNRQRLRGLVGYDKGDIHRPGIVLNVFSEGQILEGYNSEIQTMLERACAAPAPGELGSSQVDPTFASRLVSVHKYRSDRSEAIHDSLKILGGKPVDKTVLVAVDEFFGVQEGIRSPLESLASIDSTPDEEEPSRAEQGEAAHKKPLDREGHEKRYDKRYYVGAPRNYDKLVPYYGNVLVLAYNIEALPDFCVDNLTWSGLELQMQSLGDPKEPPTKKREWPAYLEKYFRTPLLNKEDTGTWPFEVGAWSAETLACIFLDAVVSGIGGIAPDPKSLIEPKSPRLFSPSAVEKVDDALGKQVGDKLKTLDPANPPQDLKDALASLARLLKRCWRSFEFGPTRRQEIEKALQNKLVPNAAVYVCWYSQLRELIDENPQLGSKLKVCPLPGRGFKGDWFLGVVEGSVSLSLGEEVVKRLCSKDEEQKRFVRGVGLPVSRRYCPMAAEGATTAAAKDSAASAKDQDGACGAPEKEGAVSDEDTAPNFLAWPRGRDTPLIKVIKIHQNALSRAHIPGYQSFRGMLGTLGRQLAASGLGEKDERQKREIDEDVKDCIKRLSSVIRFASEPDSYPRERDAQEPG